MKIQNLLPSRPRVFRAAPDEGAPPPDEPMVRMRTTRAPQYQALFKDATVALASDYVSNYLASTSPMLIPVGAAASWWASRHVEKAQDNSDRWLMVAGSLASSAAAVAMPQWSGAVQLGHALLQGLWGGLRTPPVVTPYIEKDRLKESLLDSNPHYANWEELSQKMSLTELVGEVAEIYQAHLQPGHLDGISGLPMRKQDPQARQKLEGWLGHPFPGKVYTYKQERLEGSPGVAAGADLALSREFLKNSDPVTQWFVVGHELSHIRHGDSLQSLVAYSVMELGEGKWEEEDVQLAMKPTLHAQELRADEEGADFAVERGATPQEVLDEASRVLGHSAGGPTHPASWVRLDSLRKHLLED